MTIFVSLKFHICNLCYTKIRLSTFIWMKRCKQKFEILNTNIFIFFHDQKLIKIKIIMSYEIHSFVRIFNDENAKIVCVRVFVIFNVDDSIIEFFKKLNFFRLFSMIFSLIVLNNFSNSHRETFTMTFLIKERSSFYFAFFILSRILDRNEKHLKFHIEYMKFYDFRLFQNVWMQSMSHVIIKISSSYMLNTTNLFW